MEEFLVLAMVASNSHDSALFMKNCCSQLTWAPTGDDPWNSASLAKCMATLHFIFFKMTIKYFILVRKITDKHFGFTCMMYAYQRTYPYSRLLHLLEKADPTAACSLLTVLGSCSKNKLLAPTVERVSKYWLRRRMSMTSFGLVPSTSWENSETELCNPCTIALRWRATPKPDK